MSALVASGWTYVACVLLAVHGGAPAQRGAATRVRGARAGAAAVALALALRAWLDDQHDAGRVAGAIAALVAVMAIGTAVVLSAPVAPRALRGSAVATTVVVLWVEAWRTLAMGADGT